MKKAGPLAGVKILDVTSTFLGPYCALLLAQMGADVIKVEPQSGDVVRTVGPSRNTGMAATFVLLNEGKRSISLDLSTAQGRSVMERLASQSDVVVHNMRQSAAERIGLTYDHLKTVDPRLIVAAAYGFASGGANDGRPAYDDIVQAESGIASLQSIGRSTPQYVSSLIADKTCALAMVFAVVAALYERERVGTGQQIEVPMYEFMASYTLIEQMWGEVFVPPIAPPVYPRTVSPLRRPYQTADGTISMMLYTDAHWRIFLNAVGAGWILEDARFSSIAARTQNIDALYGYLAEELKKRPTAEWLEFCRKLEVPAAPVRTIAEVIAAFDSADSEVTHTYEHPTQGVVRGVDLPIRFRGRTLAHTDQPPPRHSPRLGEHTAEVLSEAGYSQAEIAALVESRIVFDNH
ncbi:MAG: CoA transferase [Devosia sp.]|nr:CoA transferase [Devosia sp.]